MSRILICSALLSSGCPFARLLNRGTYAFASCQLLGCFLFVCLHLH